MLKNMKRRRKQDHSRNGMVMLMVLFVVMAIAIIASGFIARSDAALQCSVNYADRVEADYLAWAGMEHARALVTSPDNTAPLLDWPETTYNLDASGPYYDLTVDSRVEQVGAGPSGSSTYTYTVHSSGYLENGQAGAQSHLQGTLFYDPNSTDCYYLSVTRP